MSSIRQSDKQKSILKGNSNKLGHILLLTFVDTDGGLVFEANAMLCSVQPQEGDTKLVVLSPNLSPTWG